MWKRFEPLIVTDWVVFGGIATSVGLLPPIWRAKLTGAPALWNVNVVVGSSTPARLSWSLQVALSVPRLLVFSTCEPPFVLSVTATDFANVVDAGTFARNFTGIRPLCEPPAAVATRRPVACFRLDEALTALFPSTAPALRAKLTAATADPVVAITSATTEITSEGEGLRILIPAPSVERLRSYEPGPLLK